MPEDVVNSYNLWVDTDAANQAGQQRGDEFNIALGSQTLKAEAGQYIKLTLNNFHMYKNWQDVNVNNNIFQTFDWLFCQFQMNIYSLIGKFFANLVPYVLI